MFNGSRQSNNFTANAGGIGSTARVAISDVALKNASLDEVRAVTGHEIGHYVLKHTWYGILFYSLAAIFLFWIADRTFPWFAGSSEAPLPCRAARNPGAVVHGLAVRAADIADLQHLLSRDRDAGGRLFAPDGEPARRAFDVAREDRRYRYPRPDKIEELFFYDHPSVEARVRRAMEWKAAHPGPPTP